MDAERQSARESARERTRESERASERARDTERETERDRERQRERETYDICELGLRERERMRERERERGREGGREGERLADVQDVLKHTFLFNNTQMHTCANAQTRTVLPAAAPCPAAPRSRCREAAPAGPVAAVDVQKAGCRQRRWG